jgi:hypothetical protein
MSDETKVEETEAPAGMAALGALTEDGPAAEVAVAAPVEPKIDNLGRSYATGRRKDAAARVWVKRGTGQMKINGKDVSEYFARPVLQMIWHSRLRPLNVLASLMLWPLCAAGVCQARPVLYATGSAGR